MEWNLEQKAVEFVARLAPWLAPGPSAYFVARAAMAHLDVPLPVAILIAGVIETLGISTVATALNLYDWNQSSLTAAGNLKRGRTLAPQGLIWISIATGAIYLVVTIGLTVVLEVKPSWSTNAPAIFPVLAVVGAVNLAIRSNQARREMTGQFGRSNARSQSGQAPGQKPKPGRSQTGQVSGQMPKSDRSQIGQTDRPLADQLSGQLADQLTGQTDRSLTGQTDRPQTGQLTGQPDHPLPTPDRFQPAHMPQLDRANRARRANREQATASLLEFFNLYPTASHREAAEAIGRSKSWVTGILADLEAAGQIHRNGHGVEVLSAHSAHPRSQD